MKMHLPPKRAYWLQDSRGFHTQNDGILGACEQPTVACAICTWHAYKFRYLWLLQLPLHAAGRCLYSFTAWYSSTLHILSWPVSVVVPISLTQAQMFCRKKMVKLGVKRFLFIPSTYAEEICFSAFYRQLASDKLLVTAVQKCFRTAR